MTDITTALRIADYFMRENEHLRKLPAPMLHPLPPGWKITQTGPGRITLEDPHGNGTTIPDTQHEVYKLLRLLACAPRQEPSHDGGVFKFAGWAVCRTSDNIIDVSRPNGLCFAVTRDNVAFDLIEALTS